MASPKPYWLTVLAVAIVTMIKLQTVQGKLRVKCDFGSFNQSGDSYVTTGVMTSHFGNARTCRIAHNDSGIVRVHLSRRNHNLSTIYAVVIEKHEITFVGSAHYKDLMLGSGYHFHACPMVEGTENKRRTVLGVFMFGTPVNATFNLEINLDNTYLSPGESKTVEVQKNGLAQVLAVDVPEDSLFKLLQISVSSDDGTVSYLVVSQSCSEVQQLGIGITTGAVKKKELLLTFTKYGRITLSQYSSPKIQAGRWYIGVLVMESTVGSIETKAVKVSVTQTYSYDSIGKGLPVLYMCLVTGILGILVAVFAHFFMNSDFDEMSPPFYVDEGTSQLPSTQRYPGKDILNFVPPPITRKSFPFKCWVRVVFVHWFGRGTKTYSYLTVVLAVSFLVGSAQFVIGRWSNMISTGNRDKCYYNERCYRPIAVADLPSNFMASNVPYCLHGVILALAFSFREAINLNHRETQVSFTIGGSKGFVPYDFSLAYALSWALLFEGLFSATYHLCPSRLTFQFDSAFMFIISGLVVVALFNARIDSIRSIEGRPPSETIVQAPKYFLFFVAPLLVLNYVGSIRDTEGLPAFVEGFYWVVLVLWLVMVYIWAYRKVGITRDGSEGLLGKLGCLTAENRVKWFWLILVPISLLVIGIAKLNDWSQFFLFSCIAAVILTIGGLMSFSMITKYRQFQISYDSVDGDTRVCDVKRWCLFFAYNLHRILFVAVLFLFWVFAMYFFKLKPTAKKTALPSESRTFNDECVLWEFFDYHDIWHMLSSVALLMSAFALIYITRSVEKRYWIEALYWENRTDADKIRQKNASTESIGGEQTPGELNDIHMGKVHSPESRNEGSDALIEHSTYIN